MERRKHLWCKREEGQSVVEAALVIPLLILILCGIIDFGWIFSNQLTVNNCSREGVRYAIVNSTASNLLSAVTAKVKAVSGTGDTSNVAVALQFINSNQDITVTVTKTVHVLTPIAGIFVPNQAVTLKSASTMRVS